MQQVDRHSARGGQAAVSDSDRSPRPVATLRRLALVRRRLGWLLLLGPMGLVLAQDWLRRGPRLAELDSYYLSTYAAAAVEGLVVWALLLWGASRREGPMRWILAGLFCGFYTFAVGGQAYFFEQYNAYLNVDVSLFASNFWDSVVNQLFADFGNYLASKFPVLLLAAGWVWLARRALRPRRRAGRIIQILAPALLVASFFIPTQHRHVQAATPDVLYLHAVGGLVRTQLGLTEQSDQLRPRARESLPVAPITPRPPHARNVLLIILESVRADSACVRYDPLCRRTEYSNLLTPERYPLTQLRSMASSTAISLAVIWAGVGPHESRDVLHTWPLIFDYARAGGYDTAFWTSQNMMFGNARLWIKNLGVSKFVSATELDPTADLDMGAPEHLLAERVNTEIGQLHEPFLAVVQLSNVHYPYLVDANLPQPFQPATTSKAPDANTAFKNHYQNSVHQQDRHVASMIKHLRSTEAGKRTVIVYTSDHAEAFREHNQMGHTFSIFDEEIKVPGWIDAPASTLTSDEREQLAAKAKAYTFHVDLTPTILDLMGMWDSPSIDPYRGKMLGVSLLRDKTNQRALPMTNCAGVWSCAFENWGYMRGSLKLEARAWDPGWHCFDLEQDPFEQHNLGVAGCGDLPKLAIETFGRLPGQDVPKPSRD